MDIYNFEQKIKAYIKANDSSQAAIARKLGFPSDSLSKWIRGVNRMPDTMILELGKLLKLNQEQILELFSLAGYAIPGLINFSSNNCRICGRAADNVDNLVEVKIGAYICADCAAESIEGFNSQGIKVRITRAIEFEPEYYQAGISILNYFGTVLREKYSDLNARVRIQQEGMWVTLIVESPTGEADKIERALNEYGLVIQGKMTPEEFYGDNLKALELKQQLRMAQLQLENQKELYMLSQRQYDVRVKTLEEEVTWLHSHVGHLLSYSKDNLNSLSINNINTEGGAYVRGNVNTRDGNFTGRDDKYKASAINI